MSAPAHQRLHVLLRERERRARERLTRALTERALRHNTPGAFAAFVKLVWSVVEPRALEWAPYMDVVCHALHRQMLGDPAYRRLLINLPPGYAKSLLVSVLAPAFEWTFNPTRRKLFFTADDDLSARDSRRMRILITSDVYLALLTESCRRRDVKPWTLAFDQNEKRNFENSDRGFRQCLTLRTGVTGKRGDDLVVDDPIDAKSVFLGTPDLVNARCSEASAIIDQALESRVNDRRDARLTMVMQRLHPDDPAGRAIAEGGWKILCLPLHYDPDHPQVCPEDPRTTPGEYLHPTRDTDEDIARLVRKLGWQAPGQLEQRPVSAESLQLKPEWLARDYHCEPEAVAHRALEVWLSSDPNKKGKDTSDDSSCQVWARCDDGHYLLDRVARPMGYPEYERVMDDLIARWAPWLASKGGVLIEDTANGATYLQIRGPICRGVTLHAFLPSRDTPGTDKSKAARAAYTIRAASALAIVLPSSAVAPWVGAFRERILGWPAVGRDDMDGASQIHMRWALQESSGPSPFDLFAGV
jgi:phage terminase large subunit-like protein